MAIRDSRINIESQWPLETLTSTIASAPRLVGHIMNTRHTRDGQLLFSTNIIEKLYSLYSYTFRPVFKFKTTDDGSNDSNKFNTTGFELHLVDVNNRIDAMGHNEKSSEILKISNEITANPTSIIFKHDKIGEGIRHFPEETVKYYWEHRFDMFCKNYDRKYFCFVIKNQPIQVKDEFERQIIPALRGNSGDTIKLTKDSRIERQNKRQHTRKH